MPAASGEQRSVFSWAKHTPSPTRVQWQDQRSGSDRVLANNPQLQFINDQRGFGLCEVTRDEWRTDFMVLDKVSTRDGILTKRASAVIGAGPANLTIA